MNRPWVYIIALIMLIVLAHAAFAASSEWVRFTICTRSGEAYSTYWVRKSTVAVVQEVGPKGADETPHKDCTYIQHGNGTMKAFVIGTTEEVLEKLK